MPNHPGNHIRYRAADPRLAQNSPAEIEVSVLLVGGLGTSQD